MFSSIFRRSTLFEFGNAPRAAARVAQLQCSRRPVVRLVILSIAVTSILWVVYIIGYSSDYPPPHYLHHPHFRHDRYRPRPLPFSSPSKSSATWLARADEVRDAYLHAFRGYITYAGGHDELLPVTKNYTDNFNGWGLTLIDSLDTMWIMGLQNEFEDSLSTVANLNFTQDEGLYAPFFETVIRYIGGLLSAYALSGEGILLRKADELGLMLLPAFNTPSGLPMFAVNTGNGKTRSGWSNGMLWAEGLSCQMEYKYLAYLTGRTQYYDKVENVMALMRDANITDGLFPTIWSTTSGLPQNDHYTVGAYADSAYEYLLKQYLLTGKTDRKARDMYVRSAAGIINNLLYLSPRRNLLYVTDVKRGHPTHIFEHLSCFLPALFALGARSLGPDELTPEERRLHEWAAEGLANTCWIMYHDSKTGLGPDEVYFSAPVTSEQSAMKWVDALKAWEDNGGVPPGVGDAVMEGFVDDRDYYSKNSKYALRPETVETFYIMWRTTGDEKWRDRGWAVFSSIDRETRTKTGYASIQSVDDSPADLKDEMPSFFMAETLKYLYLLFTDEEIISLDQWVFNTEAHPLPIFSWPKWQQKAQLIG